MALMCLEIQNLETILWLVRSFLMAPLTPILPQPREYIRRHLIILRSWLKTT